MAGDRLRKIREAARRHRPTLPPSAARAGVLAAVYAILFLSALSVAVGLTLFVWSRVGLYAALTVGGVVAFGYAYVFLRAIDAATGGSNE